MTKLNALDKIKAHLGIELSKRQHNAPQTHPSPSAKAQDGKQENFTTGIAAGGTAAAEVQAGLPDVLMTAIKTLEAKGLQVQAHSLMVYNVTVIKPLTGGSSMIGLQFQGSVTQDDADTLVRRATLELQ